MDPAAESVSNLLVQLGQGNRDAEARLISRLYPELRRIAAGYMRRERPGHSLRPTALVNEAFIRLAREPNPDWQGRAHFVAVSAQVLRRILVDHARARQAQKRGGEGIRVTFVEAALGAPDRSCEMLEVHDALERLEKLNARQSKVVELRFFGGMSFEEIAHVLSISGRTAKRDWEVARAWLHGQLS